MKIAEQLCEFIRTNVVGEGVEVGPDTPFEKLGLDSFSIIEIVLFIERKYGVTIPDNELNKEILFSADTLAACVMRHQTV
jgi:acyl carrier protein